MSNDAISMELALKRCMEIFDDYAQQHFQKETPEATVKARANVAHSDMCQTAINEYREAVERRKVAVASRNRVRF